MFLNVSFQFNCQLIVFLSVYSSLVSFFSVSLVCFNSVSSLLSVNVVSLVGSHVSYYPVPVNLSGMYLIGSLLAVMFVIQVVVGICLSCHYSSEVNGGSYASINNLCREVNYGWLFQSLHASLASVIMFLMYVHVGKSLYYSSVSLVSASVFNSGLIMLVMSMLCLDKFDICS